MRLYNQEIPLFSVHIPKCAGTAFSDVLRKWFGRKLYFHYNQELKRRKPQKHRLYRWFSTEYKRGICIHGHFNSHRGYGVFDCYHEAEQLITVLRDPFDIQLSNYFYVKREAQKHKQILWNGKPHPIVENNWSLEEYLNANRRSYIMNFLPPGITAENYKEKLNQFYVHIGVAEHLQASVDTLAQKLGFETVLLHVKNASEWNEAIPVGAREEFVRNNQLEYLIYDYANNQIMRDKASLSDQAQWMS